MARCRGRWILAAPQSTGNLRGSSTRRREAAVSGTSSAGAGAPGRSGWERLDQAAPGQQRRTVVAGGGRREVSWRTGAAGATPPPRRRRGVPGRRGAGRRRSPRGPDPRAAGHVGNVRARSPSHHLPRDGVPMNAISVRGLVKRFDGHPVLDQIHMQVPEHSACVLLGPNGAGKTTTLRSLLGLVIPDGGEGTVLGTPIGSPDGMVSVRRRA